MKSAPCAKKPWLAALSKPLAATVSNRLIHFFFQTRRSARAPFLLLLLVACMAGQAWALERYEFTQPAMGTLFRITCYADSQAQAQGAADAAFQRVQALNAICSDYLPDSELIRLCRAGEMTASQDLLAVIQRSEELAKATDGAFDITVGHYANLWRRAKRKGVLPTSEHLTKAKLVTGWQQVRLDAKTRRITLAKPGMQLDLGGIAKGYAADAALQVLKTQGIACAVVAASGDLAIGDPPPNASGWEVKLRTFEAPEATDQLVTLRLKNCGVSTSGDLHQFIEIGGQRYSHIIDPSTGLGLTERRACSVIAPDCTTSDALATALCVLGTERGNELLKTMPGVQARWPRGGAASPQ